MEVKTRFAPSPTGYLHIGGARTALFNWLFSRKNEGKFLLRIEDTDRERSTQEAIDAILKAMDWLGLDWDEETYYQSKREEIHREHIESLLKRGKAYRCYCLPEELEEKRKKALKEGRKPQYDRKCRDLIATPSQGPYVVRFKAPLEGVTEVKDLIRGEVIFENRELDDLIIQRSDGTPTYNLSVVVDDMIMGITHVIRGDDHLNNTPKQILLYEALGYPLPKFAHLPMILGEDRARLSKRHGATSVEAYKEMGYLPEALINYLARLGWAYGDQEIFTMQELIEKFSLEKVVKSSAVFNPEKLLWLNGVYIKQNFPERLADLLIPFLRRKGVEVKPFPSLIKIVKNFQERAKTLDEMAERSMFFFMDEVQYEEAAQRKFLIPEIRAVLQELIYEYGKLEKFEISEIERVFRAVASGKDVKMVTIAQAVRVSLTGRTESPGLFEVIEILGKEKTLGRLEKAISLIN